MYSPPSFSSVSCSKKKPDGNILKVEEKGRLKTPPRVRKKDLFLLPPRRSFSEFRYRSPHRPTMIFPPPKVERSSLASSSFYFAARKGGKFLIDSIHHFSGSVRCPAGRIEGDKLGDGKEKKEK